jgi:enoyl-CoA hydratase/carnithine racemase
VEVLSDIRNHIAFITLNRPKALNALSLEMILRLRTLFAQYAADPDIYAVLIRGAGDKAFCAGGDIRALYHSFKNSGSVHSHCGSLHSEFFEAEYPLDHRLYSYPKPYLALMDGITLGGGLGLAQGSTFRIVGERTRMGMPEVAIGFFPDVGASYFLSRLPGKLGPYLALTGVPIRGADAVYCGLADALLAPDAIATLAEDLSELRWSGDRFADLHRFMQARAAPAGAPTRPASPARPASPGLPTLPELPALRAAIDAHFSQPTVLAVLASLDSETRIGYAAWASATAAIMRSRSPTMMSVTLRQLQRGAGMNLADCFRMELGMAAHSFEQGDFLEGVRAVLIDKDGAPRWRPSRIEDVTETMIERFFLERWPAGAHPLATLDADSTAAVPEYSA